MGTTSINKFGTALGAAQAQLWASYEKSNSLEHNGDKGEAREEGLRRFLKAQLPSRYSVKRGEVVDADGRQSGQTDILIFDGSLNAPIVRLKNQLVLLPAEALLATIEVKSRLTSDELRKSFIGLGKLHTLRPWGAPWASPRSGGDAADDGLPRIFSTVFAYRSNLGSENWDREELNRSRVELAAVGIPASRVDRIAVLDRGLLIPDLGKAAVPSEPQRVLGLWYANLVGFLDREVRRREPFPWADYVIDREKNWKQFPTPLSQAPAVKRATQAERARLRSAR